ncbi:MAG: hypothetical protein HFF60_00355 [Oscillospiraceae bacterium]|jgi:hypothetical protein|nr:hypothetical protein [Oscillospiraceae bacterium]
MKRNMLLGIFTLCLLLTGCGSPSASPGAAQEDDPLLSPAQQVGKTEPAAPLSQDEALAEEAETDDYAGVWVDEEGGGCQVEITGTLDTGYTIQILWNRGGGVCDRWEFTGSYDELWQGIDYFGSHYTDCTAEDGTVTVSAVLEEETGLLYLDKDGALLWEDTYEHMGDEFRFLRGTP